MHDGVYWQSERPLKLFVFSQLHGEVRYRPGEGVEIRGPVWFRFASPERDLALGLAAGLLRFGRIRIATLEFAVREIATLALPVLEERLVVRALSPITVYRTLEIEGKRRTQYYNPLHEEFGELVVANLRRKASVLGVEGREGTVRVQALSVHPRGKRLECYKGTWIEGGSGDFCWKGRRSTSGLRSKRDSGRKTVKGSGMWRRSLIERCRGDDPESVRIGTIDCRTASG